MKIVLFNCKYSENLGDGLIAEALEEAIRAARPGAEVVSADLAGRTGYGQTGLPNRRRVIFALGKLPPPIRRQAVRIGMGPKLPGLRAGWARALDGADLAVFGGGHLFQDGDLNFPLKVGAALQLCRASRVPVAVHAVGVSGDWSRRGRALFGRLLDVDCVKVSVRDRASRDAWSRHFAETPLRLAEVVPDPALLCDAGPPRPSTAVGVNVTEPRLLSYHGAIHRSPVDAERLIVSTVLALRARGHDVVLFTNGAAEDEAHLERVHVRLAGAGVARAPRPRTPADLIETQRGLSAVVAHRLHANILAYRLGLPAVGLGWDRKVESFYAETRRDAFFVPTAACTAERICQALDAAIAAGLDAAHRAATIGAARAGTLRLVEAAQEMAA